MLLTNLFKVFCRALVIFLCLVPAIGLAEGPPVDMKITGKVTNEDGEALASVSVAIKGTTLGALTDENGNYALNAPDNATALLFSSLGYETQEVEIAGRTTINVTMVAADSYLDEVVVTGYTSERKGDIVGSVEVIDTDAMLSAPAGNLTGQLQGRAAGIVASNDARPGGGAKVRIRGFTSFGNSDPLYIIDGVPTTDPSTLNPNDIASVQVLKDATAASIYGARAAQGVIIVTTKAGEKGNIKFSYDGYYGTQSIPQRSLPNLLNTEEYVQYLQQNNGAGFIHPVFGDVGSPTIPDKIVVSPGFRGGVSASDPRANSDLYDISDFGAIYQIMDVSDGTDWFGAITSPAVIQNHQVSASGGSDRSSYSFSLNYFNQEGLYEFSNYNRYSARMNTSFTPKKWLTVGENFQFTYDRNDGSPGGGGTLGEQSPWAWAYRMVPYLPVTDINGGFAGNAVGESGNASNPFSVISRNQDDYVERYRTFGNTFIQIQPIEGLTLRSSFGIDMTYTHNRDYTYRTYESSENTSITGFNTNSNYVLTWTWTNTAAYARSFGDHNFKVLAGTENISFQGNGIGVSTNTFDFEDPNFINLNTDQFATPNAYQNQPIPERLASVFGRIDYGFANKYLFNATVRRDGTSKIAAAERFGVFPSVGVAWRLSEEGFLKDVAVLDELKIRAGWGQMGSIRNVNAGNQFTLFASNIGISNYDLNRTQNGAVVGYTPYRAGSLSTKWEVAETINIGLDGSLYNGQWVFGANYFINNTNDLLVGRVKNGLEPQVFQPAINLGQMTNRGFELSLTNRRTFGDFSYDVTFLFTRYTNEVVDIDGNPETFFTRNASRLSNVVRTSVGQPVSYFYGYQIDESNPFFDTQAEIDALPTPDAVVGSWRFVDQLTVDTDGDGIPDMADGEITSEDQTFLGSPHPDFVTSINVDLRYKGFDFNMFWLWNQGNQLYNYNRYFTDMRVFVGGVSKRVLDNGWVEGTPEDGGDALLPKLAPGEESGYTPFILGNSLSYFVEDGSFLRLRTAQLGYTFSSKLMSNLNMSSARVYIQGQNLFTVTNYTGPDPDINISGQNPGDDLKMGVDESGFPTPRQLLVGLSVSF